MKRIALFTVMIALGISTSQPVTTTMAQESRDDFVSNASYIVGTYTPKPTDYSPQAQSAAANKFLQSMDEKLRQRAVHAINSDERRQWTNLPARPDAGGVTFGDLDEVQIKAACDMMATLLSEQGYNKLRNIMLADDQLLDGGRARPGFGTETFAIVVFGEPSATDPWAFQIDGHHVGVNVAITGDDLTLSPSFIGTQPEAFQLADRKVRPLSGEVDGAFELVGSLSEEQFKKALVSPRRGGILTGPGNDGSVPQPKGLSCSLLNEGQKKKLIELVSKWVNDLPPRQAKERLQQITNETDQMHFGWSGPRTPASDVSFTIQGPTLIIEYACQDLGGNPLDHLHTMYRDPTNEYGGQLDNP